MSIPLNPRWSRVSAKTKGTLPITLDVAKKFLNYSATDQDDLIGDLIQSAVDYVESAARKPLRLWSCEATMECVNEIDKILLPYPPLISITSISYVTGAGSRATLATTKYSVATGDNGYFRVDEIPDDISDGDEIDKLKVEWQCGYQTGTEPTPLLLSCKLLVNSWFVGRLAGDKDSHIYHAVDRLICQQGVPPSR